MELTVNHEEVGESAWVISPKGSLDYSSYKDFEEKVEDLFYKKARHLLLDMAGVKYISSVGLSAIIQLIKHSREIGATLALYDSQLAVKRVLEISKLDILQIKPEDIDASNPFFEYISAQEPKRRKERLERENERLKKESQPQPKKGK